MTSSSEIQSLHMERETEITTEELYDRPVNLSRLLRLQLTESNSNWLKKREGTEVTQSSRAVSGYLFIVPRTSSLPVSRVGTPQCRLHSQAGSYPCGRQPATAPGLHFAPLQAKMYVFLFLSSPSKRPRMTAF